jgi:hypothetical protein
MIKKERIKIIKYNKIQRIIKKLLEILEIRKK